MTLSLAVEPSVWSSFVDFLPKAGEFIAQYGLGTLLVLLYLLYFRGWEKKDRDKQTQQLLNELKAEAKRHQEERSEWQANLQKTQEMNSQLLAYYAKLTDMGEQPQISYSQARALARLGLERNKYRLMVEVSKLMERPPREPVAALNAVLQETVRATREKWEHFPVALGHHSNLASLFNAHARTWEQAGISRAVDVMRDRSISSESREQQLREVLEHHFGQAFEYVEREIKLMEDLRQAVPGRLAQSERSATSD